MAYRLHVVEAASTVTFNGGKVVIASDESDFPVAIEALASLAARRLAQEYAASKGVSDPRISSLSTRAYPVNSQGVRLDRVAADVPAASPLRQPAAYRADVDIIPKPY